jgi:type IV secretion system protein VirB1
MRKPHHAAFLVVVTLLSVSASKAQTRYTDHTNTKLSTTEFRRVAAACAPDVPVVTLQAVARAESAFHPYAVSLDYPRRTAREQGFAEGTLSLARQPKNLAEALAWTHWFVRNGQSVSLGLMQISTQQASDLGVSVDQLFDPCTNVRAGAQMLTRKYRRAAALLGEGQEALWQALSQYNSGSDVVGFLNGYVQSVFNGESYARQFP